MFHRSYKGPVVVFVRMHGHALVGNLSIVAVLIGGVPDDLCASIRQRHAVFPGSGIVFLRLLVGELVTCLVVVHSVREQEAGVGALKME